MIATSCTDGANWLAKLGAQQKQALYALWIPSWQMYLTSFLPSALGSSCTCPQQPASTPDSNPCPCTMTGTSGGTCTILPYLQIPQGQGQDITETEGHSSVQQWDITCIDPRGELKAKAASSAALGQKACFRLGWPGECLADFVTLMSGVIAAIDWTTEGLVKLALQDYQRFIYGAQLWLSGGPTPLWAPSKAYVTGAQIIDSNGRLEQALNSGTSYSAVPLWPTTPGGSVQDGTVTWQLLGPNIPPSALAFASNGFLISDTNPRWVRGNPLDIYLVALQNELGVGQAQPSNPATWVMYDPIGMGGLINPNPYLDIPGILSLRDGPMSGYRMEFKLTSAQESHNWMADQLLKPLGLYTLVRSDGTMGLKSMKSPADVSAAVPWSDHNVILIPEVNRIPIINYIVFRMAVDDSKRETAARQYNVEYDFQDTDSINTYRYYYKDSVESDGVRPVYGGYCMGFLLADRVFRRHGNNTVEYSVSTQLRSLQTELADFVLLTHPLVPDLWTTGGRLGITSVLCECKDRQPRLNEGRVEYKLLDARFLEESQPFLICPASVPNWLSSSSAQIGSYVYLSDDYGNNPDGASKSNTIF